MNNIPYICVLILYTISLASKYKNPNWECWFSTKRTSSSSHWQL